MKEGCKNIFGFSLLEIIISLGIFFVIISAVVSLALGTFSFLNYGKAYERAEELVKEAQDAVKSISNDAWNTLNYTQTALAKADGKWSLVGEGTSEQIGDYSRVISFFSVYRDDGGEIVSATSTGAYLDPASKRVRVVVNWNSEKGFPSSVVREFFLTSWNQQMWNQTDWSGGSGQSVWMDPLKFDSLSKIKYDNSGEVTLAQLSNVGSFIWSYDSAGDYTYNNTKIDLSGGSAQLLATGTIVSYETGNSDFATSTWAWSSLYSWDAGGGEVTPSGARIASGGNPGGMYRFTIPRGSNDELGAWIQQGISISDPSSLSISLNFDWRLEQKNPANPARLHFYVFVDQASGVAPVVGSVNQVWDSSNLATVAAGGWSSQNIDIASFIPTSGTYYLKLAVWVETLSNGGPYYLSYDNAKIAVSGTGSSYPIDRPSITAVNSFTPEQIYTWSSFIEDAEKNGGDIFYQLSDDDGANWRYWTGSNWSTAGASNYNNAAEVANNISSFPVANKKISVRAFLSSDGSQQVSLDQVKISYLRTSPESWGNSFLVSGTGQTNQVSSDTYKTSFRFTAQESKTINQIQLFQTAVTGGGSSNYRVGIQGDNAGFPSGTYLSSGTYNSNSTGVWVSTVISPSISLIDGTVYHIVVERASGSRNRRYRVITPLNPYSPTTGFDDNNLNYLSTTNGMSWIVQDQTPAFLLTATDGTSMGQPYYQVATNGQVYGAQQVSEIFVLEDKSYNIFGLGFYARKITATTPGDNLFFSLYNVAQDSVIASGTVVNKNTVSQTFSWLNVYLDDEVTVASGTEYRLIISSPLSSDTNGYEVMLMQTADNIQENSLNFLGTIARHGASSNNGLNWTDSNNLDIPFKFFYSPSGSGFYETNGYFISSAFRAPGGIFNLLKWNEQKDCSDCLLRFQIRTAPNAGGVPGSWYPYWCGPSGKIGNDSEYFSSSTGSLIHESHNGDEWVQYRVVFESNGVGTPILKDVNIIYR